MTKRVAGWGLLVLTVVNISALATLGYNRLSHHRTSLNENCQEQQGFLQRELGLSDTQAAQLKALREAFQSSVEPIRPSLLARREQLVQLLIDADPDRVQIAGVRREIDSLQAEVQRLVIDHLLDEKAILTPEQRSKFFSIIRERLTVQDAHHEQNGLALIDELY